MTQEAFRRALRAFSKRAPFRPFEIQLMTGEWFVVNHPEAVMVRENLVVCTHPDERHRLFDGASVCQLADVRDSR